MVHINPRVSLGFPSAMSSFLMLTSLTWENRSISLKITASPENTETMRYLVTRHCHLFLVKFSKFSRYHFMCHTCRCLRKSSAICTFCSLWNRMRPFSLGWGGQKRDKGVFSYMIDCRRRSFTYTHGKRERKAFNQNGDINGKENHKIRWEDIKQRE